MNSQIRSGEQLSPSVATDLEIAPWYLSLSETAKRLDTSVHRVRNAIRNGELRAKRTSKSPRAKFLIKPEWVEEYLLYKERPTIRMRIVVWLRSLFNVQ